MQNFLQELSRDQYFLARSSHQMFFKLVFIFHKIYILNAKKELSWRSNWYFRKMKSQRIKIGFLYESHTLWTQEVGPPSLWFWPSTRKQWFPLEIWHVQWSSSTRPVCVASLLQNSAGWTGALGMMPEMTKRLYTLIREAFNNAIVVTN